MNPLFSRLGIPQNIDTLAGLSMLVTQGIAETSHLDFKRQVNDNDELADDLVAMANSGGGVLVIGVGTDKSDRACSLHEHPLKTIEQQAVQAASTAAAIDGLAWRNVAGSWIPDCVRVFADALSAVRAPCPMGWFASSRRCGILRRNAGRLTVNRACSVVPGPIRLPSGCAASVPAGP
jgi:hypothetical protein